jgi:tetratricopeptide (TPR) repeat protein
MHGQDSAAPPPPLSKVDIFGRLAAGGSRSYVAHLVRVRGGNFSPDDDFFAAIERVGGEGVLLDRLRVAPDGDEDSSQGIGGDLVRHLANCAKLQDEDLTKAEAECRAAMTADPRNAFAVLGTAQVLKLRNRYYEVLPLAQQVVQVDASLAETHYALAMALDPRSDEALQELQEAKRLGPEELDFRPVFDARLGEPGGADPPDPTVVDFRQAMLDAQEKRSRDILQIEPDLARAHADLAGVLLQEGRENEALAEITEAVRLEPGVLMLHITMAAIAVESGHVELSLQARREAVRVAPSSSEMRYMLAQTLRGLNDFEEAREEIRACLGLDPGDWRCHMGWVQMLENTGDLDGTIAEYRRSLDAHPNFTNDRFELARVLQNNGDLKGAYAECERILREQSLKEQSENGVRNQSVVERAHEQLARILMAQGSATDAVGEFKAALAVQPDAVWVRFRLAEALDSAGASGQAQDELRDVLREDPEDATANNEMAWFYATPKDPRYRNPKAALELAQKAVAASGGRWSNIVDTLAEALTTEKKAIELDPKNADLQAQFRKFRIAALSPQLSAIRALW